MRKNGSWTSSSQRWTRALPYPRQLGAMPALFQPSSVCRRALSAFSSQEHPVKKTKTQPLLPCPSTPTQPTASRSLPAGQGICQHACLVLTGSSTGLHHRSSSTAKRPNALGVIILKKRTSAPGRPLPHYSLALLNLSSDGAAAAHLTPACLCKPNTDAQLGLQMLTPRVSGQQGVCGEDLNLHPLPRHTDSKLQLNVRS